MTRAAEFDPLVELYGMWTTGLAERYLPLPFAPLVGKYECRDGCLIMSRHGGSPVGYAKAALGAQLAQPARAAGHAGYATLRVLFNPGTWIEPDLVVLKQAVKGLTWVPADKVLIPIEFVSTSSRRRDRIDKPALCAAAGIPFFMRVEIGNREVHVELFKLDDGEYRLHAKALTGQQFETEVPFPISFDPAVLLEP